MVSAHAQYENINKICFYFLSSSLESSMFVVLFLPLENLSVWGNDTWLMWLMASTVDSSLRDQPH